MTRYVVAHGWTDDNWDNGEPLRPSVSVDDGRVVNTGLITVRGEPIMRVPDPIGFGRENE